MKKILKICIPILIFIATIIGASALKKEKNNTSCVIIKEAKLKNGLWHTDKHTYKYRFSLTGFLPEATNKIIFVVLTNDEYVTFDDVKNVIFNKKGKFDEEKYILSEIKG